MLTEITKETEQQTGTGESQTLLNNICKHCWYGTPQNYIRSTTAQAYFVQSPNLSAYESKY